MTTSDDTGAALAAVVNKARRLVELYDDDVIDIIIRRGNDDAIEELRAALDVLDRKGTEYLKGVP